jgi:hypothetical protein
MTNEERLDYILSKVHGEGGFSSLLWPDVHWLYEVQSEAPAWAKSIFEKWKNAPAEHGKLGTK